ncbi:Uncharacterised protein [Shewanella baltica]|nr:Uncharacterised protein [Shewanella baltica]
MSNENVIGCLMLRYQKFLIASWDIVFPNFEDTDFQNDLKDDWLEVNWELIVESHFNVGKERINLSRYGAGAAGRFDRVFIEGAQETHEVKCFADKNNTLFNIVDGINIVVPKEGFTFRRFVSIQDGWYVQAVPFNMVQVNELEDAVFTIEQIDFRLSAVIHSYSAGSV